MFVNVGERTNVTGSAKFAQLIREENYDEALDVARQQVEAGAHGTLDYTIKEGVNKNKIADDKILKSRK